MTPLQFAIAECANHQPDGSCAGVMINRDLSMSRASPKPRCLIAEGKRCEYFETCVSPMADWVSDPKRAASLQAAVAEYRRVTKQGADLTRRCHECGGPMAKGKQRCPTCADARRKEASRTRQQRHRTDAVTLSRKVQEKHSKGPIIPGVENAVSQNPIGDSHPPQNGRTLRDRPVTGEAA